MDTPENTAPAADVKAKKRRNVIRVQAPEKLLALAALMGQKPEVLAERMLATQVELAAANVAGQVSA